VEVPTSPPIINHPTTTTSITTITNPTDKHPDFPESIITNIRADLLNSTHNLCIRTDTATTKHIILLDNKQRYEDMYYVYKNT
jgi:hypothetical protein